MFTVPYIHTGTTNVQCLLYFSTLLLIHVQCLLYCNALSSFGPFYSAFIDLVGSSNESGNSSSEESSEFIQTQSAIALCLKEKM